jgi:hypothetical protein
VGGAPRLSSVLQAGPGYCPQTGHGAAPARS